MTHFRRSEDSVAIKADVELGGTEFDRIFVRRDVPSEREHHTTSESCVPRILVDLVDLGLASSLSDAWRGIHEGQGGALGVLGVAHQHPVGPGRDLDAVTVHVELDDSASGALTVTHA